MTIRFVLFVVIFSGIFSGPLESTADAGTQVQLVQSVRMKETVMLNANMSIENDFIFLKGNRGLATARVECAEKGTFGLTGGYFRLSIAKGRFYSASKVIKKLERDLEPMESCDEVMEKFDNVSPTNPYTVSL